MHQLDDYRKVNGRSMLRSTVIGWSSGAADEVELVRRVVLVREDGGSRSSNRQHERGARIPVDLSSVTGTGLVQTLKSAF